MVRAQRDAGLAVPVDLVDRQAVERSADRDPIPARPPLQVVDGGRPEARQIAAVERLSGEIAVLMVLEALIFCHAKNTLRTHDPNAYAPT